jgi:hypothetical protein
MAYWVISEMFILCDLVVANLYPKYSAKEYAASLPEGSISP